MLRRPDVNPCPNVRHVDVREVASRCGMDQKSTFLLFSLASDSSNIKQRVLLLESALLIIKNAFEKINAACILTKRKSTQFLYNPFISFKLLVIIERKSL